MIGSFSFFSQSGIIILYLRLAKLFVDMKHFLSLIFLLAAVHSGLFAQYYGVKQQVESSWNIGISLGTAMINGDIPNRSPGYQVGLYAQKNLSRVLDLRIQINSGQADGLSTVVSQGNTVNPAVAAYDSLPVYHNYQMKYMEASANLKININRLLSASGGESWDFYALAGVGTMLYRTDVDALNANDSTYNFAEQITATSETAIKEELEGLLDGTYETPAEQDYLNRSALGNRTFSTVFSLGGGINVNISERFGIGVEARYGFVGDDLLDGLQWNEDLTPSEDRDMLFNASLSARFNL